MMKKYIVVERRNDFTHTAYAKAPGDVAKIAARCGFEDFDLSIHTGASRLSWLWQRLCFYFKCASNGFKVPRGSLFLVQHPMDGLFMGRYGLSLGLFFFRFLIKITKSKVIAIVHDLEDVRLWLINRDASGTSDTGRLNFVADRIIVHNDKMKTWLTDHGISAKKLIVLEIFDYLADGYVPPANIPFRRSATIAGNMRLDKSSYLAKLKSIEDVEWHLYGNRYDESACGAPNVFYHGVFPAEELLSQMRNGFGIVWDGDSIETCSGNTGEYLRINNPHKLSMYIAAGLPVLIWDQSACADFVRKNGLGLTVSSLYDVGRILNSISEEQYVELRKNVLLFSGKLRGGYFTSSALEQGVRSAEDNGVFWNEK